MIVITSFSQRLHDEYAHRVVESFENWPKEAKLIIYSEDMKGEDSERIEWRALDFPDLLEFKSAAPPNPPNYTRDAARFANKVWAMVEGSMNETSLCFWLDADCITYRRIPVEFLNRLVPASCYLASFQRPSYVETGFWGVRGGHPMHQEFMSFLKTIYTSGYIYRLAQWHDCFALDYAREKFNDTARAVDLTKTLNGRGSHVMATSELGRWIDHTKGSRKTLGYSPENRWHKEKHETSALVGGHSAVLGFRK